MTLEVQFRKARKDFCAEARVWTRRKTLRESWKTAKVGSWLAWWLHSYRNVPTSELVSLLHSNSMFGRSLYTGGSDSEQALLANLLRATYNPSGRRRAGQ